MADGVSVITVARDTRELVLRTIESVASDSTVIEILLVDSGSLDGTAKAVASRFPSVRVLAATENLGFTRGNNRALRVARGEHVLLLNPDAEMKPGALRRLVDYLDAHPRVGAVGPKLWYGDGSAQSSRRRFPDRVTGLVESTVLQRWLGWLPAVRRFYMADVSMESPHEVDWLVGACMLVRTAALRQVGLFDERFFMYSEEVDLCRRLKLAGWSIVFIPEAEAIHHEAQSSTRDPTARDLRFHESRARYYAKHVGRGWSLLVRLAALAHFAFLSVEELGKWLLRPSGADLRRARVRSHRDVLAAQGKALVRAALGRA